MNYKTEARDRRYLKAHAARILAMLRHKAQSAVRTETKGVLMSY